MTEGSNQIMISRRSLSVSAVVASACSMGSMHALGLPAMVPDVLSSFASRDELLESVLASSNVPWWQWVIVVDMEDPAVHGSWIVGINQQQ